MAAESTYRSDARPDFAPFMESCGTITGFAYSAILAVAAAVPTSVAIGDGMAVRTIMKLTLTADRRLVDGELGARFLNAIRRRLEDPRALRRELASA